MRCCLHALVALAIGVAAHAAHAQANARIVVFPFDDISGSRAARRVVVPAVERALALRGYDVILASAVEQALDAERVRYLDSLPADVLKRIAQRHGASFVMVGSILAFSDKQPAASVAVRVLASDGRLLWCNNAAMSGEDTKRAFGFGVTRQIERLVPLISARLLAGLPAPGALGPVRVKRRSVAARPKSFRAPAFFGEKRRIVILPLENLTFDRSATRVVEALLRNRLAERPGIEIVEPAAFRSALVEVKATVPGAIPPEELLEIGRRVGTTLFVRGTILSSSELYLSVVDVQSRRVVWSSLHARTGDDYRGLLGLGAVRDPMELVDRMLVEMIEALYTGGR